MFPCKADQLRCPTLLSILDSIQPRATPPHVVDTNSISAIAARAVKARVAGRLPMKVCIDHQKPAIQVIDRSL